MKNELTIKYDNLELLVKGAKEITLNPQGEELLIRLLDLKEKVEMAIKQCKSVLEVAIQEVDPDLSSISSDNVKVMYRVYGQQYSLNEMLLEELDPKYYIEKKSFSPNTAEIKKEIRENGILPNGIIINDRKKTVSITLKNDALLGVLE